MVEFMLQQRSSATELWNLPATYLQQCFAMLYGNVVAVYFCGRFYRNTKTEEHIGGICTQEFIVIQILDKRTMKK